MNPEAPAVPDEAGAVAMAAEVLSEVEIRVARFAIGARHFVFEAGSTDGDSVVVRASRREDVAVVRDAVYWSETLRPLGVPLPEVLHVDTTMERHHFPFVILERLQGNDLGLVIDQMSSGEQRDLAVRLAGIQAIVGNLPPGRGYGFTPRLRGPFPHAEWRHVVATSIERSRQRIRAAGVFSELHVHRVDTAAARLEDYFRSVPGTPFLHDITARNVIVENSSLSGIVDVDDLCYGDPLFLIGLIRTALLANGHSLHYADCWVDILRPTARQGVVLDFYTALFCLDFMSEVGQRFNRATAAPADPAHLERLHAILDRSLAT